MNAAKPVLYGISLCVGAVGLAVFAGACGAEMLWRWHQDRGKPSLALVADALIPLAEIRRVEGL